MSSRRYLTAEPTLTGLRGPVFDQRETVAREMRRIEATSPGVSSGSGALRM